MASMKMIISGINRARVTTKQKSMEARRTLSSFEIVAAILASEEVIASRSPTKSAREWHHLTDSPHMPYARVSRQSTNSIGGEAHNLKHELVEVSRQSLDTWRWNGTSTFRGNVESRTSTTSSSKQVGIMGAHVRAVP
jgi:hypothetical protein